jgi:hypothetical protein
VSRRVQTLGRCQSWRRSKKPHESLHRPGECRRCWRPCRQRIADGSDTDVRCSTCVDELVHAPETWVRLALISEPSPPRSVIAALVGDGDITVNYTARWQRVHSGIAPGASSKNDVQASPAPSLRDVVVESSRKATEIAVPLIPRYSEEEEW